MTKRFIFPREVPSREDYYMGQSFWVSSRSKDPRTQCGAVIVSNENQPLGTGYNGPPKRINDADINWDRPDKYPYIVHAEVNAIKHSFGDLEGSTLYVTAPSCSKCMLSIANEGISKVIYFPYKSLDKESMLSNSDDWDTAQEIARLSNISLIKFAGNLNWMRDQMEMFNNMNIFKSFKN